MTWEKNLKRSLGMCVVKAEMTHRDGMTEYYNIVGGVLYTRTTTAAWKECYVTRSYGVTYEVTYDPSNENIIETNEENLLKFLKYWRYEIGSYTRAFLNGVAV